MHRFQAASAIEGLKMESPVKKLDFSASNKENAPLDADLATLEAEMDANHKTTMNKKEELKVAVAPTIKPEEADEPLLQENPQRFVLFPIKYHEVRDASRRVKWNTC
jgi:ribonucleoside-diphosphate reductase subunit M2